MKVTVRKQVAKGGKASKAYYNMRGRNTRRTSGKKVAKKQMIKSRQPLVETKSRIQSEIALGTQIPQCKDFVPMASVFHPLPLHAYTSMEQGIREDQMLGQSVFSRYLNGKVQVRFPGGANLITDRQYPCELIAGWIPSSTAFSTFTSPQASQVSPSDITAYIIQRISEYFNSRTDRLDFIPRHAANLKITYRKKIRPNLNRNTVLGPDSNSTSFEGHIPDVMLYPKWKTNKKVFFEQGNTYGDGQGTDRRNYYPNYSWIPFLIVYSPMFAGEDGTKPLATAQVPRVSYNVAHYYTDS